MTRRVFDDYIHTRIVLTRFPRYEPYFTHLY
jgi:hypothetical protein